MAAPSPVEGVPRALRPLVWLTAVLWLPVRLGLRGGERVLEAYDDGANAAWRAVVRAAKALGRAFVRVFGPLGRAVKRALVPLWRLVRRLWDRLGLWVLLRMLKPLRRGFAWLLESLRPLAVRARRAMAALVDRLEPVWDRVLAWTGAVDDAVTRLGRRIGRALAPVGRAVRALSRSTRGAR